MSAASVALFGKQTPLQNVAPCCALLRQDARYTPISGRVETRIRKSSAGQALRVRRFYKTGKNRKFSEIMGHFKTRISKSATWIDQNQVVWPASPEHENVRLYNSRRRCAVGNHARSAQFDNPPQPFRNAENLFEIRPFLLRGALRIRTRAAQRGDGRSNLPGAASFPIGAGRYFGDASYKRICLVGSVAIRRCRVDLSVGAVGWVDAAGGGAVLGG